MGKRKAFWLRRSIAARLTALAAVMLALLCALWAWFAWDNAADNIRQDGYDVAHSIAGRVESLLQNLGYDPAHMPEADTEAYWKLKSDLALYSSNDQPYILRYSPTVSEENASDPIIVRSPFLILNETAGPDGDPVYYSAGTYYNVDLSEFSEADLRAIQAHMQYIPPAWQENTPYMTAYGIYIQNQTDYFVPNRIVSCIDGQSWRSARPVAEQTSRKIYFHDLFDSEAAMEHYFEAVRYLNATQQSLDGKKFSDTEWEALRTENFRFDISGISYGLGTVICAYVIDWAAGFRSYFYNFPYLVLGLCLLLLFLFYKGVRHAVAYPLFDTIRQAQHVAHLEFDAFHPDTARGDEIGQLNRALADMAGDLQKRWDSERDLEDRRQQFVAAASHDLKTPLALIGGYAEAIAQDISPEENARYLAAIEQETGRMNELVREMLDYTRLDRTEELKNRQALDLSALLRSLLDEYAPLLENHRLACDIMDGVRLRGDETLLRRAFGCLLENAAKYTPASGRIAISLRQGGPVLLAVENDCDPIPPDELPRLFEMFYRGDKARNRAGGHGLGLSITQKILSLHGLACRAENTETGVRFSVIRWK